MPGYIIHLAVGNEYIKNHPTEILDKDKFIDGVIYPVGLYRNEETLEPVKYYYKMPKDISNREVLILDPMLATGGSAADAIKCLKEDGVKKIKFLSIISAPEGIKRLNEEYPDVELYTAAIDEKLNEHGYILPGLGDAGDRIFGTK